MASVEGAEHELAGHSGKEVKAVWSLWYAVFSVNM